MTAEKGRQNMSDVSNIGPKPEVKLSPEREREIYESSRATGRKIADVLVSGVHLAVDAKTAATAAEIEALRLRVERLERLLAPRLAEAEGE
jgi:hypothetical protein